MSIAVLRSAERSVSIADVWPQSAGLVVSPPAQAEAAGAETVVLDLPDEGLREALAAVRAAGGAAAPCAVLSLSPTMPLEALRALVGSGPALFRAIVPVGAQPGEGVAALAAEPGTSAETVEAMKGELAWLGRVDVVSEETLDAVSALTLGGAAFLCEALEGMEEGAVRDGMPRETARAFAHQTALATALLLQRHAGSPADLKDQVASPGGTTIAALASLEDAGVRGACLRAVQRTAVEVRRQRGETRAAVME
jgi:pyrroline-5-carboxylate reductase